jgi:VanZ family protein
VEKCGKWPLWIGAIEQLCTAPWLPQLSPPVRGSWIWPLSPFPGPIGNSANPRRSERHHTVPDRNAHLRSLFGLQLLSFCLDLEANYTSHFC